MLHMQTMTQDVVGIWKAMFGGSSSSGSGGSGNGSSGGGGAGSSGADGVGSGSGSGAKPERVPTLLVGHSMGGALAVRAAATRDISGLDGVVVIDVVEGTAIGEFFLAAWGLMGVHHHLQGSLVALA